MAKKPAQKRVTKPAQKASKKPVKKAAAKAKPAPKAAKKAAPKAGKNNSAKKSAAKTVGKVAAGLAVAGVALSVAKLASKAMTDVTKFFSPLDDRIIIEEVKKELRTPGGLFIPDTVVDDASPKEGKVLAVGRGHRNKKGHIRPLDVKLGDVVLFETYQGSPLKIGDREVMMIRESQLLGIVST